MDLAKCIFSFIVGRPLTLLTKLYTAMFMAVYVSLIDHLTALIRARYLFNCFLSILRYKFFTNFV